MLALRFLLLSLSFATFGAAICLSVAAQKAKSWLSIEGRVVAAYVAQAGAGLPTEAGNTDIYLPTVRYSYSVSGQEYIGSRIYLLNIGMNYKTARTHVEDLHKGDLLKVYYDPQEPSRAALDTELPIAIFVLLIALSALLFILALFLAQFTKWFIRIIIKS